MRYSQSWPRIWMIKILGSLCRLLKESMKNRLKRIDNRATLTSIADILNGLQFLHDLGYVHRDLNPKNILLHEGHWKLSDLGAVLPPTGRTIALTQGTVLSTEQSLSPE